MISPYLFRLLCLSLASFFLIHLALSAVIAPIAQAAVRAAERIPPRRSSQLLLALTLFPCVFSLCVVAGLCVPSYLWLEPEGATESVGSACLVAAVLGLMVWIIPLVRATRAVGASLRYIKDCQFHGQKTRIAGVPSPVWVLNSTLPTLSVAGIFQSRIVVSRAVVNTLSTRELAAAVQHERAHQISRDNLKRLLLSLAPDVFPFFRGSASLELGWAKLAEWAADDSAAAGNAHCSLALAGALVRIARMGSTIPPSPLVASLVSAGLDLSARVNRLIHPESTPKNPGSKLSLFLPVVLAFMILAALAPSTQRSAYHLLEALIR